MSYQASVFEVMIASPSDVTKERGVVRECVYEWNAAHARTRHQILQPVCWETDSTPATGKPPQDVINRQVLDHADLLIGIFWNRLGTPTATAESGTAEEIEKHIAKGKPAMLYFSRAEVRPDTIDLNQREKLMAFKEHYRSKALFGEYDSVDGFRREFSRNLAKLLNEHSHFQAISQSSHHEDSIAGHNPPSRPNTPLTADAQALLLEASQDTHGEIELIEALGEYGIYTHGKQFISEQSPRIVAQWKGALDELLNMSLLVRNGQVVFTVTREGFAAADQIVQARKHGPRKRRVGYIDGFGPDR